jgi:TusA-related sulfurtransferase
MPDQAVHDSFATGLEICYEVLLYLSSRMARLQPGEILAFVTDDPDADDKIRSWCETHDHTLLYNRALPDGRRKFLIRKSVDN